MHGARHTCPQALSPEQEPVFREETDQQLILARDGAQRRPRTGVQALAVDVIRHIRIELGSAPSGRIAVWTTDGQEAVSMFFDGRSLDRAHELLDAARPLIARSRRKRP